MNRRAMFNGLLALVVLVSSSLAAQEPEAQKTLRVYFVGNSVTDTINYRGLEALAKSRGHKHVWGRHMIPGAPLQWIWQHPKDGFQEQPFGHYPTALGDHQWDVLSLQPFDRHLEGQDGDVTMAKNFIDLALPKSPDMQVYVYARWPRQGKDDFETAWQTALVGHDGWADARLGDLETSNVFLNDYVAIRELRKWKGEFALDKPALRAALNALGDEAARHFENVLQEAVAKYPSVIAVTHVPPFKEAAWYDGRHSDDNYLPHFACKATGDVMRKVMEANPQSRLLVLCGHTHGTGEVRILENLHVLTGGAEYGNPVIQRILDIG